MCVIEHGVYYVSFTSPIPINLNYQYAVDWDRTCSSAALIIEVVEFIGKLADDVVHKLSSKHLPTRSHGWIKRSAMHCDLTLLPTTWGSPLGTWTNKMLFPTT